MDIITSHLNADFDALGSAVAAKKLYPDATVVFPGSMEKRVKKFLDVFNPIEIKKCREIPFEGIRRLIIVDTKHRDRIGPLKEVLLKPGLKIHIYDHHPVSAEDIRGEVEIIAQVGAVATLFTEILEKKKIPLSPMEATVLCLGIYEETGSLIFGYKKPRDLAAVAYLLKKGANLKIVAEFLKEEMSKEEVSLLNELVGSLKEEVVHGIKVKIGKGTMEGFGDVAHLAHQIMDMEDMDALFLLIGMADKILMVARSRAQELDVSQVLAEFGGGGHATAASATIKDMPFEIVEERLTGFLKKYIRPMKVAMDVMTAPVISILWNNKIRDADVMMTRYGVNVLPVVKNDRYTGILTREVVEKARFHGFAKSDCSDFTTTDALTAAPDTPVSEVEKLMIEQNQRFISVLDGERIVGAITRTDILRSLYEDFLKRSRVPAEETLKSEQAFGLRRDVSQMLREGLPPELYGFLNQAGEIADSLGMNAYLVGGCVRDLLRRDHNLDIDIVVEGDGISFARALSERGGVRITVHQRFGTAQIMIQNSQRNSGGGDMRQSSDVQNEVLKIDVATARTEYYESPATLPKVEVSSIKKDLYRRDFTINTLAVKLNSKDFGLLIDFFGAQRDLKDKVIRVLHNLSFVEDPTRAFRAIRFAERFGFKLTRHTENLIKLAIRMNIFEKLSGTRIYDELMLFFSETHPMRALKRLGEYDLLRVIHPRLAFTAEMELILQSVHDTLTWFDLLFLNEQYDKGMLYIMSLLFRLNNEERESALNRLSVPPHIKERVMSGFNKTQEIFKRINPKSPVEIYHLFAGADIEAILLCMALTQNNDKKRAIAQFLMELRKVKPLLKGDDLKALGIAPGPVYSEIFTGILNEKLIKRLLTKDEEKEYVRKWLKTERGK